MFTFVGDTLPFSHQHHIRRRIANGHYTLFDNGSFHTPARFSRARGQYVLDENARTASRPYRCDPDTYGKRDGKACSGCRTARRSSRGA